MRRGQGFVLSMLSRAMPAARFALGPDPGASTTALSAFGALVADIAGPGSSGRGHLFHFPRPPPAWRLVWTQLGMGLLVLSSEERKSPEIPRNPRSRASRGAVA